jgi:hypothetical protein
MPPRRSIREIVIRLLSLAMMTNLRLVSPFVKIMVRMPTATWLNDILFIMMTVNWPRWPCAMLRCSKAWFHWPRDMICVVRPAVVLNGFNFYSIVTPEAIE